MNEAISATRAQALAAALRDARSRLGDEEFARLHARFIVAGPNGTQWTIGLDDLNWYCAIDGRWVTQEAPEAVAIDGGMLRQLEELAGSPATPEAAEFVARLPGHSDNINTVAVSPLGGIALSAGDDGSIRLWDLETLDQVSSMTGGHGAVYCAAFSIDGQYAFAGVWGAICVWDLQQQREIQRFGTPNESVSSIAVAPDGRLVLSGGDERLIHIWETATGRELATIAGFREAEVIQALAISPDGNQVASGGIISGCRLWDLRSTREVHNLGGVAVNCIAFSPDGREMAATGWSDDVFLYDPATGQQVGLLQGHTGTVEAIAYSDDGLHIATASHDCSVRVWDAGSRSEIGRLNDHREIVRSVAFTPGGRILSGGGGLLTEDFEPVPGSDFDLRLWR